MKNYGVCLLSLVSFITFYWPFHFTIQPMIGKKLVKNRLWPIKAYSILGNITSKFKLVVVRWKTFIFQTQQQVKATDTSVLTMNSTLNIFAILLMLVVFWCYAPWWVNAAAFVSLVPFFLKLNRVNQNSTRPQNSVATKIMEYLTFIIFMARFIRCLHWITRFGVLDWAILLMLVVFWWFAPWRFDAVGFVSLISAMVLNQKPGKKKTFPSTGVFRRPSSGDRFSPRSNIPSPLSEEKRGCEQQHFQDSALLHSQAAQKLAEYGAKVDAIYEELTLINSLNNQENIEKKLIFLRHDLDKILLQIDGIICEDDVRITRKLLVKRIISILDDCDARIDRRFWSSRPTSWSSRRCTKQHHTAYSNTHRYPFFDTEGSISY